MIDGVCVCVFLSRYVFTDWLSVWDRDTASAEKSSDYLEKSS